MNPDTKTYYALKEYWTMNGWSLCIYELVHWQPGRSQAGTAPAWKCQEDWSLIMQQVASCDITSWCQAPSAADRAVKEGSWDSPSLWVSHGDKIPPLFYRAKNDVASSFPYCFFHSADFHFHPFFQNQFLFFKLSFKSTARVSPRDCSHNLILTKLHTE